MPELPEVETIRRFLQRKVVRKVIKDVWCNFPKIIAAPIYERFIRQIKNRKIIAVQRRGKFLLFYLDGNKVLISHLKMTGHWLVVDKNQVKELDKHTHLQLILNKVKNLAYEDIRKFGRIWLIDGKDLSKFTPLQKLGPDPLAKNFTLEEFRKRLSTHKARLKTVLLNQSFIAGLGNIYTDEVLFAAGIHPLRKANRLKDDEYNKIYQAIRRILSLAIKNKGTTVANYMTPDGSGGDFQHKLKVYQRTGEKCYRCGKPIERIALSGRGTHFCPQCQK